MPRTKKKTDTESTESEVAAGNAIPSSASVSNPPQPLAAALSFLSSTYSPRYRDTLSMSSIGDCAAKQLFDTAGFEKKNPPTPRTQLTWKLGDKVEEIIVDLLMGAGWRVYGRQKQYAGADPARVGHVDGLVLNPDDNKLYLFDAKSANERSFNEWLQAAGLSPWSVMKTGLAEYWPHNDYRPVKHYSPTYYYQLQGYLERINNLDVYGGYRIDNIADPDEFLRSRAVDGVLPVENTGAFFFVMCKNTARLYQEWVPYDENAIYTRLQDLDLAKREIDGLRQDDAPTIIRHFREVPREENGKLNWKCERCPFVEICWEK